MATIYPKTDTLLGTKNALILDPHEAMFRPFNFSTWNHIRIGMYHSPTLLNNANGTPIDETVNILSYIDWLTFGLIDQNTLLPGQPNVNFVGITTNTASFPGTQLIATNSPPDWYVGNLSPGAYIAYTSVLGGVQTLSQPASGNLMSLGSSGTPTNPGTYAGFAGLDFTVQNYGLATQTITVQFCGNLNVSTALTLPNLRTSLLKFSLPANASAALPYNSGGSALPLPTNFFFRCPLLNNQFRIHAYDAFKIS